MSKRNTKQDGLQRIGEMPLFQALTDRVQSAAAITPPSRIDFVENELIRPEDLAYTHSVFVQCFMPLRHNANNSQEWETGNRYAKLLITAGRLVRPESPGEFKKCVVPAGPKARMVAAYVNDYAYRSRTPVIDLGESMRHFMQRAGIPIGGKNGKELQRELENFAASEIILGVWTPDGSAHQEQTKVARRMSFWIDKNPDQRTLWQPQMTLSAEYYTTLLEGDHIAPIYWPGNIALQHNPRAMDILNFMTYRLRKPLAKPVVLHARVLHGMFGRDVKHLKHFWPRFKQALAEALKHYPTARIEILNDGLKLYNSPPLVPYRKVGRIVG